MKKTIIASFCAILLIVGVRHLVRSSDDRNKQFPVATVIQEKKTTIENTISELESTLKMLEREASGDLVLMKHIAHYRSVQLSPEEIDRNLKKLRGMNIDLIPMIHLSYEIDDQGLKAVTRLQQDIFQLSRDKYKVFWAEDFCGGKLITKDNAWHEIKTEMENATVPLKSYDFSRQACEANLDEMMNFSAAIQLMRNPGNVMVMGGDYRPIKNIQQRIIEYAPLYDIGRIPSALDPKKIPEIQHVLSKGRDLYLLSFIAEKGSFEPQVIVFGQNHALHIAKILLEYGAKGKVIKISYE